MQYNREFGFEENTPKEEVKKSDDDEEEGEEGDHDFQRKKPKKTKEQIDKESLLEENYYELLGIPENKQQTSNETAIAKAYRKKAL